MTAPARLPRPPRIAIGERLHQPERPDRRRDGEQGGHERAGQSGERTRDRDADRKRDPRVDADQYRPVTILGDGSDRTPDPGLVQERPEHRQDRHRNRQQKELDGEHPHAEDLLTAAHQGGNAGAGDAERELHDLLDEEGERKRDHHDVGDRPDIAAEHHEVEEQGKHRHGDDGKPDRREQGRRALGDEDVAQVDVGEVGAQHEQGPVGQIEDAAHGEHQHEADRHERVDGAAGQPEDQYLQLSLPFRSMSRLIPTARDSGLRCPGQARTGAHRHAFRALGQCSSRNLSPGRLPSFRANQLAPPRAFGEQTPERRVDRPAAVHATGVSMAVRPPFAQYRCLSKYGSKSREPISRAFAFAS